MSEDWQSDEDRANTFIFWLMVAAVVAGMIVGALGDMP